MMDSTMWSNSSSHWGTFWGQFTIELLGGVIGALIFLFIILLLFRPRVKLATFLCKQGGTYFFKFINQSFFNAHEIKVELHEIRKIPMGNGYFNRTFKKLSLLNAEILYIPGKPFIKNPDSPHCITVRTVDDISKILNDQNCAVILRVSLKHGLTGISSVFEMDYATQNAIKQGDFKSGTRFAVNR